MRFEWAKEIDPELLPEPYKTVAKKISLEAALLLAEEFGGIEWYFPKLDRALVAPRNQQIRKEFDGTVGGPAGYRALARKYNLTESQIRAIVEVKDDRQTSFLD